MKVLRWLHETVVPGTVVSLNSSATTVIQQPDVRVRNNDFEKIRTEAERKTGLRTFAQQNRPLPYKKNNGENEPAYQRLKKRYREDPKNQTPTVWEHVWEIL